MKANPTQLYKFLQRQETQFVIPIYQRNYDWSEEQCQQLFDDITDIGKAPKENANVHFIGSIVYICNDEYTTEEIEQYVIIDGQQRITTITLLLIALYHFAQKLNDSNFATTIYEYYLINKNALDDASKIKLKATDNNDRDINLLLINRPIQDEFSNIRNNYNFFKEKLTEDNYKIIYEGFKRLLFVEIKLERGKDNAQKIFESLNSTGLDLSQADLIRNYILMGLAPAEQTRLYKNYWFIIENNTKSDGTSYLSDFIRDYLTLKTGDINNKNKVYTTFKQQFRLEDNLDLECTLQDILKYSYIYKILLNPDNYTDADIKRELKYINYIEINVSYPFILQIIDDYNNNKISKATLLNILRFIQTYVCRRFILDLPTNALNKIFMNLYKQIDHDDYENSLYIHILSRTGKTRMPSDAEISSYLPIKDLYNAKSKMKLYILECLENFNNREFIPIIDCHDITIEHIFPQSPDNSWRRSLPDKQYKDFTDKYIHTIGNLTLSGNNGKLGNKSFLEKQQMNDKGGEQGYKFSRMWLNRFLNEISTWDYDTYKERSRLLTERFLNIWRLPKVELKDIPTVNVCDPAIDLNIFTNKEIEYAIFFDNRISGHEYKGVKLYNYIIKSLFELSTPEEFIPKFKSILKISDNPEELRKSYPLNSTYFYENNLSYKSMFKNLREVLIKLDLPDELSIKLRTKQQE